MGKYLKEFELTSQYEEYINSTVALLPNVSLVKETPKVLYNPYDEGYDEGYDENQYEYVDLGLSVKWATCNVGASSPEEYGLYFAWGETEEKSTYTEENYKYYDSSSKTYNSIGSNISNTSYDVVHVKWGGNWRMPTSDEYQELLDNTTTAWTTVNGVKGMKFTSIKEGYTDNYIFVPASGFYYFDSVYDTGSKGYLWSSSFGSSGVQYADGFYFSSKDASVGGYNHRYGGNCVRGVLE